MEPQMNMEIKGLEEAQAKAEQVARDIKFFNRIDKGMQTATLLVQRDAKIFAPVDTGRLRASITPELRRSAGAIYGVVGSNVVYAPYQELGTKFMEGRRYLQRALEKNQPKIKQLIGDAVAEIVSA